MTGTSDSLDLVLALLASHRRLLGVDLLPEVPDESADQTAARLYAAPFVVLAHDYSPDPRFTYANLAAQQLFERRWDEFVGSQARWMASG